MPLHLIRELPPELAPSLIEDRTVKTGLLLNHPAVLFNIALGRLGHVPYLQILNTDERVVLADRCCGLVQEIFSGVSDAGVNLLDFGFRLFPVITNFYFAAHATLIACKALLVFLEAILRRDEAAITHGGKPCNADIDTDGGGRCWQWRLDLALRLNRDEPLATRLAHSHIADFAQYIPAVAVAYPA